MKSSSGEFASSWPILVGSFLGIAIGVSSLYLYSLGIFIKPMAAEFGWPRGVASLGALVGTAGAAIMSVPMGRIVDRVGSVPVGLCSVLLLAAGFAALAWLTTGLASFLLLTAILSLLTAGSSPLAFSRLVVASFVRHRGIALGLALAGNGSGAILTPMLLSPYIAAHGWRAGYLALAVVILVFTPLVWWLIGRTRDTHTAHAAEMPFLQLLANPAFRLLALIFFLAAVAILGTIVQFVPMLTDWGLSPLRAGSITALIGAAAIGGRLLAGALLDRFPAHWVSSSLFLIAALGIALLALSGAQMAIPAALVVGLAVGTEVDLIAFMVGRHFIRAIYGQTFGALYAAFLIGGAIGPALSGYLQQLSGSYRLSLFMAATLLALAGVIATQLSRLTPVEGQ
jgi:MFS family permease